MNNYIEQFIDQLYFNQNNGASNDQKNLFSKADYYKFLKDVIEVINQNKDASLEELRKILFNRSGIVEAAKSLVYERQLCPGLVFSYGTTKYQETIVVGNRQEVTINREGNIVSDIEEMTEDTIFDLASVTKIFTSISVLKLIELGIIKLSDTITKYVPEFINLKNVTIFDLLAFQIPLITDKRIDEQISKEDAEKVLFNIQINENFNKNTNPYTDMGAMVLKYVIERVTNMPYYSFIEMEILKPLGLIDTYVQIPQKKLYRVANTNLDGKIYKDGTVRITTQATKGIVYDKKARIMGQPYGNLSGHAGLFSSPKDMTNLAKGIINGQVLGQNYVFELGKNRTGRVLSKDKTVNYLGYLCSSKNPLQGQSEVFHALSSKAFASPGWLGNQLTIDPVNDIYTFMASNRSHNRMTYIDPSIRPSVELEESNKKFIILPNGERRIDASRFAWNKGTVIYPALRLVMQYKLLDEILKNNLKTEKEITRIITK